MSLWSSICRPSYPRTRSENRLRRLFRIRRSESRCPGPSTASTPRSCRVTARTSSVEAILKHNARLPYRRPSPRTLDSDPYSDWLSSTSLARGDSATVDSGAVGRWMMTPSEELAPAAARFVCSARRFSSARKFACRMMASTRVGDLRRGAAVAATPRSGRGEGVGPVEGADASTPRGGGVERDRSRRRRGAVAHGN